MATSKDSYDALLREIDKAGSPISNQTGGAYSQDAYDMLDEGYSDMLRELQGDVADGRMSREAAEEYLSARKAATAHVFAKSYEAPGGPARGSPERARQSGHTADNMMEKAAARANLKAPGARGLNIHAGSVMSSTSSVPLSTPFDALLKIGTKGAKAGLKALPLVGLAADFADIPEAQAGTMYGSEFESSKDAREREERDIESEQFLAEQPPSGMAQFAGPEGGERYAAERFGTPNDQEPVDIALQPTPEDITGGEVHIEEEDALLEKATQADDAMDEALLVAAPAGDFSAPALNALVEALNEVLPVMGLEDPYPTFEEDVEGTVPVEFVKYLTMVSAAATDAGLDRFAVKLEDIGTDTDLMKAAGQLDVLSKNDSFRSFMATTGREEAAAESDSTPVDFVPTPAPPTEDVESVLERRA